MTFIEFAAALGVVINTLPPIGEWKRFPTIDHPKKRNGSARFFGDHGHVCNFETGEDAHLWRPDSTEAPKIDHEAIRRVQEAEAKRIREAQVAAAKKAGFIMHSCRNDIHAYMASKGFPEERVKVWEDEGIQKMIVPMRVGESLVNVQQIWHERDQFGEPVFKDNGKPKYVKKFLYQARAKDAEFIMDNRGLDVLCEGFATAYSARMMMTALKFRYRLHVTFSAGNMKRIAEKLPSGVLIVDHDTVIPPGQTMPTGQRIAKEIGWPMWISSTPGFDLNDEHQSVGLFQASQSLRKVLVEAQRQQRVSRSA